LQASAGPPLAGKDLALFDRIRAAAVFALDQPAGVVHAEQATENAPAGLPGSAPGAKPVPVRN
jgi:hypothetical protein